MTARIAEALRAMVDRWEPDCVGTDRVMWENAVAALAEHDAQPAQAAQAAQPLTWPAALRQQAEEIRQQAAEIEALREARQEAQPQQERTERERFEAWWDSDPDRKRFAYDSRCWEAWQTALAQRKEPTT